MLQWSAFMALPFQRQLTIAFQASWAVNIFLLGGSPHPPRPLPPHIPDYPPAGLCLAARATVCVVSRSEDRRLCQLQVEGHPRQPGRLGRCAQCSPAHIASCCPSYPSMTWRDCLEPSPFTVALVHSAWSQPAGKTGVTLCCKKHGCHPQPRS